MDKDYEKLLTVDLLCHGVPIPAIWEKYIERKLRALKAKDVKGINFRTKKENNEKPVNSFLGENNEWQTVGEECYESHYFAYFMRHIFRSSCYQCAFRSVEASYADFTLGDCWNAGKDHPKMQDNKGISTIIIHSNKAKDVYDEVQSCFSIEEEDVAIMKVWYEDAKIEEREDCKKRQWKLSNRLAQYIPLKYMQMIYMHDRVGYVLKRKMQKFIK